MVLQVTLYVCMDKLFLFLLVQLLYLVVVLLMTFDFPTCVCSQGMFHPQILVPKLMKVCIDIVHNAHVLVSSDVGIN